MGVGRCTVGGYIVLGLHFFFLPQMIHYTAFPTISLQLVACMWDGMEKTMYLILLPSKQDQRAVIYFLGAESCQPVEIYHRMHAVYGNACVQKQL